MNILESCTLCPRECGINRYKSKGFCGESADIRIARWDLHYWEEPAISGKNGSGTVFFSGCCLKCCFCQNYEISAENKGYIISVEELADIFLKLQDKGASNINLVNPTHFVPQIISALDLVKNRLNIPIVYNTGGYEKTETIKMLSGYVDIYLPDIKYHSNELSTKYSYAKSYYNFAINAIKEMVNQVGKPKISKNGLLKSGVIVRHLILPNCRKDSINLMNLIGESFASDEILISLMSQYTPIYKCVDYPEINRRTSTFEYNSVIDAISPYGFDGYMQKRSAADKAYIPDFFDEKK